MLVKVCQAGLWKEQMLKCLKASVFLKRHLEVNRWDINRSIVGLDGQHAGLILWHCSSQGWKEGRVPTEQNRNEINDHSLETGSFRRSREDFWWIPSGGRDTPLGNPSLQRVSWWSFVIFSLQKHQAEVCVCVCVTHRRRWEDIKTWTRNWLCCPKKEKGLSRGWETERGLAEV